MQLNIFLRKCKILTLLTLFGMGSAFLSVSTSQAKELRMAVITPPSHVWTKIANRIADRLAEASDNSLMMKVFPAGQLGTEQIVYQQMSVGLVDAGLMTAAITSLRAPSISGWFTPYLFKDVASAAKAAQLPAAQKMLKELESAQLVGLGYGFAGMRHLLMAKDRVAGPNDLQSKKIRIVPFPAMQTWWDAVGAVATPVNLPEVYQSMQSGLLDGIDIDLDALVGLNYQEVGKYLSLTNHMVFPSVMVVSQMTWNALTKKEKQIYKKVVAEALSWGTEQQIAAEKRNLEILSGQIEVIELREGRSLFKTANKAVQNSFEGNSIIRDFQDQVQAQQ